MILLLATALAAEPPTFVLGASAGYNWPTRQGVTSLDFAVHPDHQSGFSPLARVRADYAIADGRPYGDMELGFTGVIPDDNITGRLGVVAGTMLIAVPYPVPYQVSEPDPEGFGELGFLPSAMMVGEISFYREAERGMRSVTVGLRAGAASGINVGRCDANECRGWGWSFAGSLNFRADFWEHVHLDLQVGNSLHATLGYRF
jgi:hypothetical protein